MSSPGANLRTSLLAKRRAVSIWAASSTGNIWGPRVSMSVMRGLWLERRVRSHPGHKVRAVPACGRRLRRAKADSGHACPPLMASSWSPFKGAQRSTTRNFAPTIDERRTSGHAAFHRPFLLEAVDVAVDRGDGEQPAVAAIAHHAIPRLDVTLDLECVPLLGMADIVDRKVVMLAPEERDIDEAFAPPQDIARDGLALALGNDPVFDPERFPTVGIRPSRNIAGGIDSRRAGLQVCVYDHAAVDREAGLLGKLDARPHANADNYEV